MMNDHFFTWPPDTVEFANDDIWGGIFIIIGFSLIVWVIDGHESMAGSLVAQVAELNKGGN